VSADVLLARTGDLSAAELAALHQLCARAFEIVLDDGARLPFPDVAWDNACGGSHAIVTEDGVPVAHGSVVPRELHVEDRALRTGYVEAVATRSDRRGRGLGTAIMRALSAEIRARFELGALDTSVHGFYERLGWERWLGPTFVRTEAAVVATPEKNGSVMILRTRSSPRLDLEAPISCEWRPGNVW
jgi:aminoglycoside 2'-N-acetyltransferase I